MRGTRIAVARKLSGITQENVVRALHDLGINVVRSTYINWEKGISEPRLSEIKALAKIFNVPWDYFFD